MKKLAYCFKAFDGLLLLLATLGPSAHAQTNSYSGTYVVDFTDPTIYTGAYRTVLKSFEVSPGIFNVVAGAAEGVYAGHLRRA